MNISFLRFLAGFSFVLVTSHAAFAGGTITPELQATIDKYKQVLTEWAADPTVIAAVKASNAAGGTVPDMTNAKWNYLDENDPTVMKFKNNPAANLIMKWEDGNHDFISKLYLRDQQGNLIASSRVKPLVYNNKTKTPFEMAMKGQAWAATEIKPDPGTQVPGVHVSVPVMENGKPIGILHSSVIAK